MRYSSATIVFVEGTPAEVKDELITWGGDQLDDAVQVDIDDLNNMLESTVEVSEETRNIVIEALVKRKGEIYQFV